jgi:hypothetical protein
MREISWFVYVYLDIKVYPLAHFQQEVAEEGTRRSTTYHSHTRSFRQAEIGFSLLWLA